jgi:Uma2 family endonuclease
MQTTKPAVTGVSGEVIATGVSAEEYMEQYAEHHCEWVNGTVVKMSPIHERHDFITRYLSTLLDTYFALQPIGRIREDPFVMKLSSGAYRVPDIQVILHENPHTLHPTYMDGPADMCIEVVSPGSVEHDRGVKFKEYEQNGVREYWIVDPVHQECLFYHLDDEGVYRAQHADSGGNYQTPLLPGLLLHVPTLWLEEDALPNPVQIVDSVRQMLAEGK